MGAGGDGEAPESEGPDADEEGEDKEGDGPCGRVLARPEVFPIASVRGAQEVILDENGNEEPDDDFAAEGGGVEGRDAAGRLAVVVGQAEEEEEADGPQAECDGHGDASESRPVRDEIGGLYAVEGKLIKA